MAAEYKARRRHVPAFGEWNYYYSPSASASPEEEPAAPEQYSRYGGAAARAPEWWCSPEPDACSDVWFRYSPPPRKPAAPAKKARRTAARPRCGAGAGKGIVAPAREQRGGAGAAAAAAVAAARAPGKGGSRGVVRPVDEDLYQVPPPDDFASSGRRPRQGQRRASRSLWMGCLGGLGCIA